MAKVTTLLFGELALLPIQAQAPARETLEWKTDLHTSYNGTEQAIQVRASPRQRFSYSIPEQAWVKASAFLTLYGALRARWAIPVWSEPQYIGAVAAGGLVLPCSTANFDFRNASLALLYQSPDAWQIIEISTVAAGQLNLTTTLQAFGSAYLLPVRLGYVSGSARRNTNGHTAMTDVLFEVEDNITVPEVVPAQFLGDDLYTTPTLFDGSSIVSQVLSNVILNDYELGKVGRNAPWTYNRVERSANLLCQGPAEVRAFRQWLSRRAGKSRRYWEPSFENDLQSVATGALTIYLNVKDNGYLDRTPRRNHIAIELTTGTWLTRTVLSAALAGSDVVQLVLDSSLAITASQIKRISFLGLKRFNTDRIELNWIGNNVMQTAINTVEIQP